MQRIASATSKLFTRKNIAEQCFQSIVPDYALVFFDHLHSEYLAVKPKMQDERVIMLFESLSEKRAHCKLTWSDIYTFDLALVDERPLENLVRKAYDARSKYRSIAGQKEYDEYLASKPPDLTAILIGRDSGTCSAHIDPTGAGPVPTVPESRPTRGWARGW